MKENVREEILEQKKEYDDSIGKSENLLKRIDELAILLKNSDLAVELRMLGEEYKNSLLVTEELKRRYEKRLDYQKLVCSHPLLAKISYKARKENNRLITTFERDEAEHAILKCFECGKRVFTKNNDRTEDWDSYIITPNHLIQYNGPFVKREVLILPENVKFSEIYNYYQSIMFEDKESVTVRKTKEKIYEK